MGANPEKTDTEILKVVEGGRSYLLQLLPAEQGCSDVPTSGSTPVSWGLYILELRKAEAANRRHTGMSLSKEEHLLA